ncbi:hypothetical protein SFR_5754 [Streptomyces sp. FR-008]|nr:hypothetical protein SFR_5754 [Streptomyces sp. FR-008]
MLAGTTDDETVGHAGPHLSGVKRERNPREQRTGVPRQRWKG